MAGAIDDLSKRFAAKVAEHEKAHRARVEERRDARLALAKAERELRPIEGNLGANEKELAAARKKVEKAQERVVAADAAMQPDVPSTDAIAWALWDLLGGKS